MQLIIFGASNALGRRLIEQAEPRGHTVVKALREEVEYRDVNSLHDFFAKHEHPDSIILNLAALSPQSSSIPEMVLINSFFPHLLASVAAHANLNVIHVSSDSVFSGHSRYKNTIESNSDPTTYYGKSRALGEVLRSNVIVARTSYVGIESGMVKWLINAKDKEVDGWVNYKWSGTTIDQVAKALIDLCEQDFQFGVRHLSAQESISKFDAANLIVKKLGLDVHVKPVYYPYMNRTLVPTNVLISLEEAMNDTTDHSFTYLRTEAATGRD